jgi:hypothetical protein
MNYVLIGVALLLLIGFAVGYHKGLLGILIGMLSWVIILGLLYIGVPQIQQAYMNGPVYEKVERAVETHIKNQLISKENKQIDELNKKSKEEPATEEKETKAAENKKLSDVASAGDFFSSMGIELPEAIKKAVAGSVQEEADQALALIENLQTTGNEQLQKANKTIVTQTAKPIAAMIVRGLAMMTALLLGLILTRILRLIAHFITDLPIIGGITKGLGGAWGVIVAMMMVWIMMDIVTCFAVLPWGQYMMAQIKGSEILNVMYMYNPLNCFIV